MHFAILGSRGYPSTYGGFETFVRRIAPWLTERGHDVTVFGRGNRRSSVEQFGDVQVVCTRGLDSKALSTSTHGLTAALSSLRTRPDAALVLNVANGPALPLLSLGGIPTVTNVDGIEWQRAKWGAVAQQSFKLGARMAARWSSALVADSMEVSRIWKDTFGADLHFIPYGAEVPIEPPNPDRVAALGIEPGTYVLVVARLVPENNVEVLLEAAERCAWSFPLVVVGSANYANPTEDRLRSLAKSGRLTWLGHVSDERLLIELWRHAALYFHGHSVGGTNPALLQAMACGAAVLAVDSPFNAEVLRCPEQLASPDSSSIAKGLLRMLRAKDKRQAWGEENRSIVQQHYSWLAVLEAYERLLMESASQRLNDSIRSASEFRVKPDAHR